MSQFSTQKQMYDFNKATYLKYHYLINEIDI